MKNTSKAIKS